MKCMDCRVEEATEFHSPTGHKLPKSGRCRNCYERSVRDGDTLEPLGSPVYKRTPKPRERGKLC